tara:strand:+ start:477 stop:626 length:150 start_codon:yes stop_codon:yes gene_type:complete
MILKPLEILALLVQSLVEIFRLRIGVIFRRAQLKLTQPVLMGGGQLTEP